MGAIFAKPRQIPPPDERFYYWLLDDLKNIRIQVINSQLSSLKRKQILVEIERAEERVKPHLKEEPQN